MAENTKIEWCDHTFNPWHGCRRISSACDNCYAADIGRRFGVKWDSGEYKTFGDKHWQKPLKWQKRAVKDRTRPRVFCASMGDVFDKEAPAAERLKLWELIKATPNLDWLILTKRPKLIQEFLPDDWGQGGYPNVWLGTTVENQKMADLRIPYLLEIPAAVRFLSIEPLLGAIDLTLIDTSKKARPKMTYNCLSGKFNASAVTDSFINPKIHWVIAGGETGSGARPTHPDWIWNIKTQCAVNNVPFFFKQWGSWCLDGSSNSTCMSALQFQTLNKSAVSSFIFMGGAFRMNVMRKVGKKLSGRKLYGETYNEFPDVGIDEFFRGMLGKPYDALEEAQRDGEGS